MVGLGRLRSVAKGLGLGKTTQELADEGQKRLVDDGPPYLGDEPVPMVEEYVYLGVIITRYFWTRTLWQRGG